MPGISIMLRKVTYFNGWEVQCGKREVAWNPRLCQMAPGSDPFWNQTASLVCVFTFSQKNMENHFEQIPSISHSAVRNKILTTQTLHLSQRERETLSTQWGSRRKVQFGLFSTFFVHSGLCINHVQYLLVKSSQLSHSMWVITMSP